MVFYGLFKYWYAPNDWRHDVVRVVRCIRSFCERKLIHSHPNNSRHPFFQPKCKSIMVMPMNVKESDNFFRRLRRSVGHFSSKFRPKLWISFFRPKCQISRFRPFFVQNEFLVSLFIKKHKERTTTMVKVYAPHAKLQKCKTGMHWIPIKVTYASPGGIWCA